MVIGVLLHHSSHFLLLGSLEGVCHSLLSCGAKPPLLQADCTEKGEYVTEEHRDRSVRPLRRGDEQAMDKTSKNNCKRVLELRY